LRLINADLQKNGGILKRFDGANTRFLEYAFLIHLITIVIWEVT